jgi:NADH-quinone oxidoreductase subunit L
VTHIHAAPGEKGAPPGWEAPLWFGPALYVVGVLAASMTAFYMFRALFLTFWGDFRGWKVAPASRSSHPPAEHHEAEGAETAPAPAPHESPWMMTVPLFVLATFAVAAGVFNPTLISKSPGFEAWLEPIFKLSDEYVKVVEGSPSPWLLAFPGVAVFFVGAFGAYFVYVKKSGAPARSFAERFPSLYQLVYDKWRIDELYESTVLAAVDAFAETSALFDKWIIDGIIARLTALAIAGVGAILRAFQTGVVHVYAAVMAVGIGGLGWFFVWHPQAHTTVHEQAPGKFLVEASPGLGYRFRWHSRSADRPDAEAFSSRRSVEVEVSPGETKLVRVDVKNAFNRTSTATIAVTRPTPSSADGAKAALAAPGRTEVLVQ